MKKLLISLIAISALKITVYAQSAVNLTTTVSQFEKAAAKQPDENVYLHLDKPYYAAGDNIWFKAYVTTGPQHALSAISKVLNIVLTDDMQHVAKNIKLPIVNGVTWGDITLPDSLPEGNYHLIAYTNWMRNNGSTSFFNKSLFIGNAITNKLHINADFKKGPGMQLQGKIGISDGNNLPLSGKPVSYQWLLKAKTLSRGNAQTDADGNISIIYSAAGTQAPDAVKFETILPSGGKTTKTVTIASLNNNADVQFFPESGNLVSDVNCKVAFKAIGTDGLGIAVSGQVTDDSGTEVARFTSAHAGMGVFNFTPQSNKQYTATVKFTDGTTASRALPAVLNKGYVLSISQPNADHLSVRISTNTATLNENTGKELSLIAQANGKVNFAALCQLQNTVYIITIPYNKFNTGIAQFTLSLAGQPVNERLAFIQGSNLLNLNVAANQSAYQPRSHVTLNISAADAGNQPVTGTFSVSVIDNGKVKVNEEDERTIETDLLLTADLKGYVEHPNYYFMHPADTTRANLDILMLTQGYRKFSWKTAQAVPPALTYQPEKGLNISGRVVTLSEKPVPNANVTLFLKATGEVLDTVTNDQGKFTFHNLIYTDTARFVLQALNGKRNDVQIQIDPDPSNQIVSETNMTLPAGAALSAGLITDYLQNSAKTYSQELKYGLGDHSHLLKEVNIKAKKATMAKALEFSNNLNGPGRADQVLLSEDLENQGGRLTDVLRGKLTGVRFVGEQPVSAGNLSVNRLGVVAMGIIIDGILLDYTYLNRINPLDVGSIEVLRSSTYLSVYGGKAAAGLLVITTKHGGATAYDAKTPGVVTYKPVGFYASKEFYAPRYEGPQTSQKMADLRTTIFWKPNLVTNNDGKTTLDFFNADAKGPYRVAVEGMDANGNIGRLIYTYNVE